MVLWTFLLAGLGRLLFEGAYNFTSAFIWLNLPAIDYRVNPHINGFIGTWIIVLLLFLFPFHAFPS